MTMNIIRVNQQQATELEFVNVHRWQFFVSAVVVIILFATGCTKEPSPTPKSPAPAREFQRKPFAQQVEAVKNGEEDAIELVGDSLTDQQVSELTNLSDLRVLSLTDVTINEIVFTQFSRLAALEQLKLLEMPVTDQQLLAISQLDDLTALNIPNSIASESGIKSLLRLPKLELLRIGTPHLSDESMAAIAKFPSLRFLILEHSPVSDAGLDSLSQKTSLESLYLNNVAVSDNGPLTDAGIAALLKALPNLHFHINSHHHDSDKSADHSH